MAELPKNADYDVLIVIPSVCDPKVLIPTVERIAQHAGDRKILLTIAANAPALEQGAAELALDACVQIAGESDQVDLLIHRESEPIGFGAANNRGLLASLVYLGGTCPELVIFHNDDAHVTEGWLESMLGAASTQKINGYSDPWDPSSYASRRPDRDVSLYGSVGLVGPMSNLVAGTQQITAVVLPNGQTATWDGNTDKFAEAVHHRYLGQVVTADFLSGFCIGITRECLGDLLLSAGLGGLRVATQKAVDAISQATIAGNTDEVLAFGLEIDREYGLAPVIGPWDEDTYRIAGYEDNDLCVRAEALGWRPAVVGDCFIGHIGHQTFDRLFPDMHRGMRNRLRHYRKWQGYTNPDRELHISAVCRLKLEVGNDLHVLGHALRKLSTLVDSVCFLLTNNPLEMTEDPGWEAEQQGLSEADRRMVKLCEGHDAEHVAEVFRGWVAVILCEHAQSRFGSIDQAKKVTAKVSVGTWTEAFNERDERNETHRMAEADFDPDWIFSFDADEVVEPRITRVHMERYMRHPDPGVRSWDQAWINHWDSSRLARENRPWGDEGTYTGGMHGYRLWRVAKSTDIRRDSEGGRRIISGNPPNYLHCGNSPDHDATAKRISAIRFQHFGYARHRDRVRKHRRYQEQDPNANPMLTGNGGSDAYGHLIAEEGMRLTPFAPRNGIGLHLLMYEGESAHGLANLLDQIYGVVDRIVIVWTGEWRGEDQEWLRHPTSDDVAEVQAAQDAHAAWVSQCAGLDPTDLPPTEPPRLRLSQRGSWAELKDGDRSEWYSTGPNLDQAAVAEMFGASWVHHPLEDNLGAARNAGLEALAVGAHKAGLSWSLFFDLDEVLMDPFNHIVSIRRLAEVTDSHGWMFRFRNHHRGGPPSVSQSIRMARLLPGMRFNSRVHETFEESIQELTRQGADIQIRVAPFEVLHLGLGKADEDMAAKFQRYQNMLILELMDNPHNAMAWVSLALHFTNDGRDDKAKECLERGVLCASNGYLPYRELAFWHLRRGAAFFEEAMRRCSPGLAFKQSSGPLLDALREHIHPQQILGRGPLGDGPPTCPDFPLPDFTPPADLGGFGKVQELSMVDAVELAETDPE